MDELMHMRKPASLFRVGPLLLTGLLIASVARAERPNVIFIPADELNNWTGKIDAYDGPVHTPNMDRLAARGVAFTRAYCNAPACNPSRASFLSGLAPATSGAYYGEQFREILPDVVTLPQYFRENGYVTAGAGKVFHSFNQEDPASWDEYLPADREPWHEDYPIDIVSSHRDHQWAPTEAYAEETLADHQSVTWAIEFMQREQAAPFFLSVGFIKPHHPWVVPTKYFEMYPLDEIVLPVVLEGDVNDLPPYGRFNADMRKQLSHDAIVRHDQWKLAIQGFLASVTYMDAQLGRLMDALDASPHADNTIMVLFGDNGMSFGEKRHWTKWGLWEQTTQVPLIFAGPGVTARGAVAKTPVGLLDVYPTLVELAGLPTNRANEGESLVPVLRDPNASRSEPVVMTYGERNHAVRDDRWRYIRYRDGTEELYDHANDPREWNNLAGDPHYDAVRARLAQYLPETNAPEDDFAGNKIYWPNDPTLPHGGE